MPADAPSILGSFSTWSMTRISTGPLADSSFNPSCSFSAVKIEGPARKFGRLQRGLGSWIC